MFRKMYDKTLELSAHPKSTWYLAAISFIESSFFPIPPDVMLIPMILANRAKAWLYATICTVSSVLGGLFGYIIGLWFFQSIGQPLIEFYGYGDKFMIFQERYEEYGAWIVGMAGVTPFPYKVITITSGFVELNLLIFMIVSTLARGFRFFLVAGLLWQFGDPMKKFIDKHFGLLTTLFFVLLFAGFFAIKYLF